MKLDLLSTFTTLLTRSNYTRKFAVILVLSCLYSPSIFAAHLTAQLAKVDGQPTIRTVDFGQDIRQLTSGDKIAFPDEVLMTFTITNNAVESDGSHSISAKSASGLRLLVSADDSASYGSITGQNVNYTISTMAEYGVVLIDQKHRLFPEIDMSNDALVPPNMRSDLPGMQQMPPKIKAQLEHAIEFGSLDKTRSNVTDESNITMLVIYSSEFGQGFSSPIARINDLINFTNQSMSASDIKINFTLARAQQLNFDNSLTTLQVLTQVTDGIGAFASVPEIRDQVVADMVAVLSFQEGFSSNGVAWLNGGNADFAFSSTRLSPGCCNSVFAHEIGHNLGSGHETESVRLSSSSCSEFNFTGFSCGHGNASAGWGTIMSRLNSEVAGNVFSNPLKECVGEPCGVPEGQIGAADNARSFNITRLLVENFRSDPAPTATPDSPRPRSIDPSAIQAIISFLMDDG